MPNAPSTIKDILGSDGLLAHSLQRFEFRPSQMEMALLIQDSIRREIPAIVEAGTGTGKTFGYLVPIILSGKKAVISTGTKNLQEQIYFKDLPLLQKVINRNIDAMIMKGRKNYLCLHKYHQHFLQSSLFKSGFEISKQRLEAWLKKTSFGDRAELSWMSDDDPLWEALSSSSDQCLGIHCMFIDECFLGKLRSRAARSKIIIVNHHLFFSDLKVKKSGFGEIIPRFQIVLFDEAHNLEEIGTFYFGENVSTNQITDLISDIEKRITDLTHVKKGRFKKHLNTLKTATEELRTLFEEKEDRGRLDHATLSLISEGPARTISRDLKYIYENIGLELDNGFSELEEMHGGISFHSLRARAEELNNQLDQILWTRDTSWLTWYEKHMKSIILHASPLDISKNLNELLYQKVKIIILTSATLSTNGNFSYIRSRLGMPEGALEGIYPSHFNFENQSMMYIPKDISTPNDPNFGEETAKRISDIVERTQGRALVLFTSYHNLNLAWHILKGTIPFTILRQGDAPRSVLLDRFRDDVHSILLGTASFWQGVDVPGESLSCLIIDKLPFDSPGEPLVAARIDAIRESGGNPFMEYQVPAAIIALKQGLGRLIRKSSDRGILSILDSRILTSRYGRLFLDSLPRIPISYDLSDISRFFETITKGEV